MLMACNVNFITGGKCWAPQNLIVDREFKSRNVIGFCCFVFTQLVVLFLVFYTISFSLKAHLNTGIAIAIWSIMPIIQGAIDFTIFGVTLMRSQVIGIVLVCICVALIGLRDFFVD